MSTRRSSRNAATEAAQRLLQGKFDLIGDLADARDKIDALEDQQHSLDEKKAAARADYSDRYREARGGGWTDEQLTELACPASYGDGSLARRRRRRPGADATPPQRPARPDTADAPAELGSTHPAEPMVMS